MVNFDTTSRRGGGDVRGYHNLSRNFATCYWIVDFSHAGRIFSSMIAFSVRSATLQARPSSQGTLIVGRRNTDGERPLIGSSGIASTNQYSIKFVHCRWWKTMMKPAAQKRRGALGWVVVLLLAALALFTLVAVFSYLAG